ncbi:hypothetical protein HDV00_006856 [Rhizophlyctis rosea]|nr:hypothetical protein HDV00_006856 [Rhizophlyctis rosea]
MQVRHILIALAAASAVNAAPAAYGKTKCHRPSKTAGYSVDSAIETPAAINTEGYETPAYSVYTTVQPTEVVYSRVKNEETIYSTETYYSTVEVTETYAPTKGEYTRPAAEATETYFETAYSTAVYSSVAPAETNYSTEIYSSVKGTETAYSTEVYSTVEAPETVYSTAVYPTVETSTVEAGDTETETGASGTYSRPERPTTTQYEPVETETLSTLTETTESATSTTETETAIPSPLPKKLKILHTNDIHSHLDQFTSSGTDCKPANIAANTCFGGIARIKKTVETIRDQTDYDTLLFDAGDQFQGTLFFNVFGGEKVVQFMNDVKYDVMAIGNHEFDNGEEYLYEFLSNLTFPVLSSNIDLADTKYIKNVVKPYTVIEKYGLGIIGFITNTTADITLGALGVEFFNPVHNVTRYVEELHAMGIKRIMGVSHNGYEHDKYLAENVPGISLIVGGHSHSLLLKNTSAPNVAGPYPTAVTNPDGKKTWIVQSYRWGNYLGNIDVEWDENDEVVSINGDPILLDQIWPVDNATALAVAEWRKSFAIFTETYVGVATDTFTTDNCRVRECAIGDLIADSMLDARRAAGVQIAFTNVGGIRAGLDAGNVSVADILTILPFGNTLVDLSFTGAKIVEMLESSAQALNMFSGKPVISNPYWAGLKFTQNNGLPAGSRISNVQVYNDATSQWENIVLTKTYLTVTNDFVAAGGDNIVQPAFSTFVTTDVMADALQHWIEKKGTVSPTLDGRWEVVAATP